MENRAQYALEIVDMFSKTLAKFEKDFGDVERMLKRFDSTQNKVFGKKPIGVYGDQNRSLSQLRENLRRYQMASEHSFRSDHIRKYNVLIDETNKKIKSLEKSTATCSKKTSEFGNLFRTYLLPAGVIGAGVGAARKIYQFTSESVMNSAQMEKYGVVLKTMLGSTGAARQRMDEYTDIAKVTPFELNQVVEAGNQLQAMGRYSRANLMQLGDLAAASGKPMEQVMRAYANLSTGQKGESVKMFRDLLISTEDWMKATGKGKSKSGELLASTEEMVAALPKILKAKGYLGMMEAQAKTTEGKMSNLSDAMFQLKANIGDRMKPAFNGFLSGCSGIVESLNKAIAIPTAEKIAREKAQLNALVGAITSTNLANETRSRLLTELQQQHPEFLKGIDLETVKNEDLRKKLSQVNGEYREKMRLASMKDVATGEEEKLKKLYVEQSQLMTQRNAVEDIAPLHRWLYANTPADVVGLHGTVTKDGSSLGRRYKAMALQLAENPNDSFAKEYVDKYVQYQGLSGFLEGGTHNKNRLDRKLANTNVKITAQEALVRIVNKNYDALEHKSIYTQAQNTNIADSGIYERMFGDNKKKASALEAEFEKLRKTTFEALKDVDFDRLAQFMDGSLAARNAAGGAGTGLTELAKQQDTITGGGKNVKNININLQNLIGTNNNNFQPGETPQQADNFMQKLSDALQLVLNDANGTD